ncbi:MAG: HAMP domain-containing sensor histidine kinase [Bacillota bacterium]|nr:HAMP domain-containing sensor histidine kinase [Bacillota bacterium]
MTEHKKRFVSLNLKMVAAVLAGMILACITYAACLWFTGFVTEIKYTGEEAVEKNVGEAYDSLREYINTNHVKGTDNDKLSEWLKEQGDTYLFVYDNYNNYFEAGWWNDYLSEEEDYLEGEAESMPGDYDEEMEPVTRDNFKEDVKNRIIGFEDREYYVFIDTYKEKKWQDVMGIASIVISFAVLFVTVLLCHRRMIRRIAYLSSQVQQVSDGKLDYMIRAVHNDEIGLLAESVDNMRTSIIRKHQSEKEAWNANTELITAMSHDIRTPLTSMIGYLDIIESREYENSEQLERYISSCREKAFQLKDLSDKLFQYFLVYGNKETDINPEKYDAGILFQQILTEHCAELPEHGFVTEIRYEIPERSIVADITGLRRLFDNIFSNVMKYADREETVRIYAELKEGEVCIRVINKILRDKDQAESTRIGLKTCAKICSDMKGRFSYEEQGDIFVAEVRFPVSEASEKR